MKITCPFCTYINPGDAKECLCGSDLTSLVKDIKPKPAVNEHEQWMCEAFLAAASKNKRLSKIVEGMKILQDKNAICVPSSATSELEELMQSSKMNPYSPHVASVNKKWMGSRYVYPENHELHSL